MPTKISLFLFLCLFILGCSNEPSQKIIQGEAYGTTWQLKYFSENNEIPVEAIVIKELNRIDDLFSHYKKNSLTSLKTLSNGRVLYPVEDLMVFPCMASQHQTTFAPSCLTALINLGR